eukprot:sb/3468047/
MIHGVGAARQDRVGAARMFIVQGNVVKNSLNLEIIRGKLIFAQSGRLRSREKSEGTKVFSDLELVGVGAGIKSLSHLVYSAHSRFWSYGYSHVRKGVEKKTRALEQRQITSGHNILFTYPISSPLMPTLYTLTYRFSHFLALSFSQTNYREIERSPITVTTHALPTLYTLTSRFSHFLALSLSQTNYREIERSPITVTTHARTTNLIRPNRTERSHISYPYFFVGGFGGAALLVPAISLAIVPCGLAVGKPRHSREREREGTVYYRIVQKLACP